MKKSQLIYGLFIFGLLFSCGPNPKKVNTEASFGKGTFGYDLGFLKSKDSVVVLTRGEAQVIVSPKYQGKVFT